MAKFIVTGGAGFLGSHLCERLLDLGHEVTVLDNLFTGSKKNLANLLKRKGFRFVNHNVIKPYRQKADGIFNLACPASPPHYQKDPLFTLKTSIQGAFNALELARNTKAKVFQSSTSEVYGDPVPEAHPQSETYRGNVNPIGIRACYDEGKRAAETLFFDFHRIYGLEIKVVRIFNTYGPRMDSADGRVVTNFIIQALKGEPLTVYGDGTQTRSFCYVDDLIDGFVKMMDSGKEVTGPINLGNPSEFTILELAEKIIKQIGSKSKILFQPLPSDDPLRRKPDISLAKQILSWEPKVSLEYGLKKTIEYYRTIL